MLYKYFQIHYFLMIKMKPNKKTLHRNKRELNRAHGVLTVESGRVETIQKIKLFKNFDLSSREEEAVEAASTSEP